MRSNCRRSNRPSQEHAACHPDVSRFCQAQLQINPNDVLGILGCLQATGPRLAAPASRYWRTTVNKPIQARDIIMRYRSASVRRGVR